MALNNDLEVPVRAVLTGIERGSGRVKMAI